MSSHPSLSAAVAGHEAATLEKREKRSALYPTVNLSATGGRIYGDNSTSRGLSVTRGAGYSWLWEGSATLRQNISSISTDRSLLSVYFKHLECYVSEVSQQGKVCLGLQVSGRLLAVCLRCRIACTVMLC